MGIFAGPEILNDGLVLALDAANSKGFDPNENLVTYSEQFDNAAWGKSNTTITANTSATTAPDGTLTADKLIEDTANSYHFVVQSVGTISGSCTISCFLKSAERYKGYIQLLGSGGNAAAFFDLNLGTITGGSGTNTITAYPNGWYRITSTLTFTTETAAVYIVLNDNSGTAVYAGSGTSGIYIWGAQVERSLIANPYYATTATAKTRGSTLIDLSRRGNTGTLTNTPTYSNGTLQFRVASSQYATCTFDEGVMKSTNNTGSWTIETAFKYISAPTISEAVVAGREGCHGGIYINTNNTLQHAIKTDQCWTGTSVVTATTMTAGNWYHTTMVYNNGVTYTYLNGVYINTASINLGTYSIGSYSNTFYIGGIPGGSYYTNIDLSFVKMYKKALSAAEVSQNFNTLRGRYGV
jgi:hypothetical protein